MIIHLIRHTTPKIRSGLCYGQTDLDVESSFAKEAQIILGKLEEEYDVVFTSPLKRCTLLAERITSNTRITDPRLMEFNFGDWELMAWDDFKSEAALAWMDDVINQSTPNGDSMITMQIRVDNFWQDLMKRRYQKVAIVTHAGVQRLIHGSILKTPLSHLFRLQLAYGAILEVNFNAKSGLMTVKHL